MASIQQSIKRSNVFVPVIRLNDPKKKKMLNLKYSAAVLVVFCFLGGICFGEKWQRTEFLDQEDRFEMSWNITESHIIIKLLVKTTGWLGVGFSDKASMVGADIYVGWVKGGKAFITDRHGVNYSGFPPKDEHQDVELVKGHECNGQTSLVFRRPLKSCDENFDRPITKNTMRVLYAFDHKDPYQADLSPRNHHRFRGAKSVLFFDKANEDIPNEGSYGTFSLLSNASLSIRETYYYCRFLRVPASFNSTHHVIKIEPVIEHKHLVHHMTLYECPKVVEKYSKLVKESNCLTDSIKFWRRCIKVVAGWAVGGRAIVFPKDVGLPIGPPAQSRLFKLEIHYDNLGEINPGGEVLDRSGFRFTHTPRLRKYDAGSMVISHYLSGYNLVVPPHTDEFDTYATCGSTCLSGAMEQAGVTSINLINVFLHTHRIGRKISFRHFRNSTELPPIWVDNTYDNNYQETRKIFPERVVKKGDYLQTVCTYSNAGSGKMKEGGLSISEEMCSSFVFYYPRIPLTICNSAPNNSLSVINDIIGVKSVRPFNASRNYLLNRFRNLLITEPNDKAGETLDVAINKFQSVIPPLLPHQAYHDSVPMTCLNQNSTLITSQKEEKCFS